MARTPLTEAEIIASIPAARELARIAEAVEPRAASAHYDRMRDRIVVELTNGCSFGFKPEHAAGLAGSTADQLAAVEVEDGGEALHWEELDADVSLPGLMLRLLNVRAWAAKYMGHSTSEAKAAAARENGRKGGRPRKVAEPKPGADETPYSRPERKPRRKE